MPRAPRLLYRNRREVLAHIEKLSRTPYQELLADFMRSAPDSKAIKAFAQKYPDRWAQAVTIISQLAGFEKGITVNVDKLLIIGEMSDAELLRAMGEIDQQLAASGMLPAPPRPPMKDVQDADVVSSTPAAQSTSAPQGPTP